MERPLVQAAIHNVFEHFKRPALHEKGVESHVIMDDEAGYYQFTGIGWNDKRRAFDVYAHVELKNNLVFIQVDNTEPGLADALLEQGVPKEQIVLAFQSPNKRVYSGFATGE